MFVRHICLSCLKMVHHWTSTCCGQTDHKWAHAISTSIYTLLMDNPNTHTRIHSHRSFWLWDFHAVHQQCVNDAISSLAAAHSLDAAVMVTQGEVRLCAVINKLTLRSRKDECFSLEWMVVMLVTYVAEPVRSVGLWPSTLTESNISHIFTFS